MNALHPAGAARWRGRVLCGLIAALPLLAPPARAGDCWVADAPHEARAPRAAQMARAAELLRQDPAVAALAGVRYQLHRHAGIPSHPGAPGAARVYVMLHAANAWVGTCGLQPWADRVHPASLSVHLNDLAAVFVSSAPEHAALKAMVAPRETARIGGYPVYEGRLLVITPAGVPPFVPVTAGQWLDAWQQHLAATAAESRSELGALTDGGDWDAAIAELARQDPKAAAELRRSLAEARQLAQDDDPSGERAALRALRAAMSPAALAAPAWVSSAAMEGQRFALAQAGEPGAQPLVQINPALWRGAGPTAVRTVALEVFLNRSEVFDTPDTPLHADVRGWLARVDPRPYAALITP